MIDFFWIKDQVQCVVTAHFWPDDEQSLKLELKETTIFTVLYFLWRSIQNLPFN